VFVLLLLLLIAPPLSSPKLGLAFRVGRRLFTEGPILVTYHGTSATIEVVSRRVQQRGRQCIRERVL
jgi:hypothetical protein